MQDACELLNYESYSNGDTIYSYGDQCDKMFIILEGKVEFSLDMNENRLSSSEVEELSRDFSKKDKSIVNQFQKFKNQVGLGGCGDPFTNSIRKAMTVKSAARKFLRCNSEKMALKISGLPTKDDNKKAFLKKSGTLNVSPFEMNTPSGIQPKSFLL